MKARALTLAALLCLAAVSAQADNASDTELPFDPEGIETVLTPEQIAEIAPYEPTYLQSLAMLWRSTQDKVGKQTRQTLVDGIRDALAQCPQTPKITLSGETAGLVPTCAMLSRALDGDTLLGKIAESDPVGALATQLRFLKLSLELAVYYAYDAPQTMREALLVAQKEYRIDQLQADKPNTTPEDRDWYLRNYQDGVSRRVDESKGIYAREFAATYAALLMKTSTSILHADVQLEIVRQGWEQAKAGGAYSHTEPQDLTGYRYAYGLDRKLGITHRDHRLPLDEQHLTPRKCPPDEPWCIGLVVRIPLYPDEKGEAQPLSNHWIGRASRILGIGRNSALDGVEFDLYSSEDLSDRGSVTDIYSERLKDLGRLVSCSGEICTGGLVYSAQDPSIHGIAELVFDDGWVRVNWIRARERGPIRQVDQPRWEQQPGVHYLHIGNLRRMP